MYVKNKEFQEKITSLKERRNENEIHYKVLNRSPRKRNKYKQ